MSIKLCIGDDFIIGIQSDIPHDITHKEVNTVEQE